MSPLFSCPSEQVVNGVQPVRHENGLSIRGDIIHLANQGNTTNGARDESETMANEPILTFESEDSFIKKAGPMKPQHVAGTVEHFGPVNHIQVTVCGKVWLSL